MYFSTLESAKGSYDSQNLLTLGVVDKLHELLSADALLVRLSKFRRHCGVLVVRAKVDVSGPIFRLLPGCIEEDL